MKPKNLIGPQVRHARIKSPLKLTQEELASRLQLKGIHLDRSAVAKVELGSRPVTDIELVAFASVLKVTAAWLLEPC